MHLLNKIVILIALQVALILPISASGDMSGSSMSGSSGVESCMIDPLTGERICLGPSGEVGLTGGVPVGSTSGETGGTITITTSGGYPGGYSGGYYPGNPQSGYSGGYYPGNPQSGYIGIEGGGLPQGYNSPPPSFTQGLTGITTPEGHDGQTQDYNSPPIQLAEATGKHLPIEPITPTTDLNKLPDGTILHVKQGDTSNAHELMKVGNDKDGKAIFQDKLQNRDVKAGPFNTKAPSGVGADYVPESIEKPEGGPIPKSILDQATKDVGGGVTPENCHDYIKRVKQAIDKRSNPTTPTTSGGP